MYASFGYLEFKIWLFYQAANVGTRPEIFLNVFYISISAYNLEISKFWIFVLDVRCLEEEEAEVMEVFPHIHHRHRHRLLNNFWPCRHSLCKLWCRISRTIQLVEHHVTSVVTSWRAALGVFSCHWSTRSRWLASCSEKATQHSVVRRPAEGVVRVRITLGRSSRLVGVIRIWTSH